MKFLPMCLFFLCMEVEAQQQVSELNEKITASTDVLDRVIIRAPVDGIINDLAVFTRGGVVKPGDKYDLVAESELGEKVFASPAMSEGQIFVRGEKTMQCFGERKSGVAGR